MSEYSADAPGVTIAVVGGSVRGTSLVERLVSHAAQMHGDVPVEITVFDPHPPGSGRIWRDGQPQTLIMNTVAAQSTVFLDDSVEVEGPRIAGPTLAQWCADVVAAPAAEAAALPAPVAAEAARTRDDSSPSRLLYGHYLRWAFARIVAAAPASVTVTVVPARVDALAREGRGWRLTANGTRYAADAVVLAVGWLERDDVAVHPRIVPPGNPIDQDLSAVTPGETVAIRGLGMGFFDTLSLLTEGRGGRFSDDLTRYEPSGREPRIVAGSRRGVPYRAKPAFGAPPFFPAQRILRAALPALHARRPVDFARDVLPLIERDAQYDHYTALDRVRPGAVTDLAALQSALVAGDPVDLDTLVPDGADRLDLHRAAAPLEVRGDDGGRRGANADAEVAAFVRADAAQAALGADSPVKLGLHSYAAARGALIDLVAFGGVTAASFPAYRRFLAVAASFGSGPPLRRARQLLALHDAGIVTFTGPAMAVLPHATGVRVTAPGLPAPVEASRLVEAWLPTPTVAHTADPLLRSLRDAGFARAWRHRVDDGDGVTSDALDIRPADGAVIGGDGEVVPGLFSVGVPHEDIRVFTIIAPVPGTNSSVLRETDAAARASLAHAAAVHAAVTGERHAQSEGEAA
ncbi:FAD/NAD(P)-binding protein [Microbacterium telephonicum]|uniref:FAD-NAD(P)-binding protein n=1 Tax=Microbacterium telephonicum TaxID=1714841 RepID=A0A498C4A9_9MICO|nr:FAD/NAD(P)-binding protein [Microbacterium telephonicum]RLK47910.1 FAD-NAD(P)-binding protein [Microbacterium telephonicum]